MNKSPWIEELDTERYSEKLSEDISTDITIVGAGIAGMSTAFFLLKYTDVKVVVLEKGLLAHGATGHNAGMLFAGFERPLFELGEELGVEYAVNAQKEIESGWGLIEEMIKQINSDIPYYKFLGYIGLRGEEDTLAELKDVHWKKEAGLTVDSIIVADSAPFLSSIPEKYKTCFEVKTKEEILKLLETENPRYVAAISNTLGTINSALVCQKLLTYFQGQHPDRFKLYENTNVGKIVLKENIVIIDTLTHTIETKRVILCTNGFENFEIFNTSGLDIDTKFHHLISGKIGYMVGYTEAGDKKHGGFFYNVDPEEIGPNAKEEGFKEVEPFLYVTVRPYKNAELICIGGPESALVDRAIYDSTMTYPEEAQTKISQLLKNIKGRSLNDDEKKNMFAWHGLMGYTPTGVRLVGVEPKNNIMLYNLGCNGIGLIPSIVGGRRISRIIAGEKLPPSLFDPVG